jgi:hypothetical protein
MEKPDLLAWGAGAITINAIDMLVTRKHLDKIRPAIHVTWHLAAALALYKFNQAQIEVSNDDMQDITLAMQSNKIPGFLNSAHEEISNHILNFANRTGCTIM